MGGDGGSIPRRVELVKAKKKPERANRRAANAALWRHCTLSQDRLRIPIVSCQLGRLYNKESVINKLLSRSNTNDVAEHIRRLKDVRELRLTVNNSHTQESDPLNDATGEFYCPVTGLEMSGVYPFVYLWTCGCVFAKKALDVVNDYRCMQIMAGYLLPHYSIGACDYQEIKGSGNGRLDGVYWLRFIWKSLFSSSAGRHLQRTISSC
ncbi:unnamed protein product [Dicrocoelium dendriticum]|nr:unnamed protein product [Dicrocoelium dendriticum]